jgi:hypothetical protein
MIKENWPFSEPPNTAVITLKSILAKVQPILLVVHDAGDGGWQFLAGGEVEVESVAVVSLEYITQIDPSILSIANLSYGWRAERSDIGAAWQITEKKEEIGYTTNPALIEIFNKHGAASFDKQMLLHAMLTADPDDTWSYNTDTGLLKLGSSVFQTQILGSESYLSSTWLWNWANEYMNYPDDLMQTAFWLKAWGEQQNIQEFVTPMFDVTDEVDGHFLSMLAVGLTGASCYYASTDENGALFILITESIFTKPVNSVARVQTVFPQFISNCWVPNHHAALLGYLQYYGLEVESTSENIIVGRSNTQGEIRASFDNRQHLTNLEAKVLPQS